MSLTVKNKKINTHKSFSTKALPGEYICIGSYEDKPTNCIYYFLYSEDNVGVSGKYDCIVEYDQIKDVTNVVYQDGKTGSNGVTEGVLNFDKDHLITGINKVENILYFTDNFNRPRKIDVEKAKRNEQYIKLGPTFQGILKESTIGSITSIILLSTLDAGTRTVLVGVTNNHPFEKNDHLYLQQFGILSPDLLSKGYNGYAKADGIIKPFGEGTTSVSPTPNDKTVTMQGTTPTSGLLPGDFVCIETTPGVGYLIEIDFIVDTHTFEATTDWTGGSPPAGVLYHLIYQALILL